MSIKKLELRDGFILSAEPSIQVGLWFGLYEQVFIGGTVENSENIELVLDPNDKHYLTGFRIMVNDTSDATIKQSIEKAKRLTNYISFRTNTVVRHKRPTRVTKKKDGKTETTKDFSMDALLVKAIDLDIKELSSLLDSDSPLNQCFAHYHDGIKSLLDNDFSQAVKDFFLIIENSGIQEAVRYQSLRDAVNHNRLDSDKTLEALRTNFEITIKKREYLNINDPSIQEILETEARKLKEITQKFINSENSD
jgi:hypothetical protein